MKILINANQDLKNGESMVSFAALENYLSDFFILETFRDQSEDYILIKGYKSE